MPLIVRWPVKIKSSVVSDHHCALWDFFATACELAGVDSRQFKTDGLSYLSELTGKKQSRHDYLYFQWGRKQAIRSGKWKLHRQKGNKGWDYELYDLGTDPGEKINLAAEKPELVSRLNRYFDDAVKKRQK